MASHAVSRPVVVDVTSEETGPLLRTAIDRGFDIVLANKKPLAGTRDDYDRLVTHRPLPAGGSNTKRPSAPVLPVIDTFRSSMRPAIASCGSTAALAAR
jgi:aspartokinase/homoserine dehydrogenase 1